MMKGNVKDIEIKNMMNGKKGKDIEIKIKTRYKNISNIKNIDNIGGNYNIINNGDLINQAHTNIKKNVKHKPEVATSNSNTINNYVSFAGYNKSPEIDLNEFSFVNNIKKNVKHKPEITTSSNNIINNISFIKKEDNSIKTNKGSNTKKSIDKKHINSNIKVDIVDYFSPINQGNTVKTSKRINMKKDENYIENENINNIAGQDGNGYIEEFKNSLKKAVLENYKNFDILVEFFSFFIKNGNKKKDYYLTSMLMQGFVQKGLLGNNAKDSKTIDIACNQVMCDCLIDFLTMQNAVKSPNTDILGKYIINLTTLAKKLKKIDVFTPYMQRNILRTYFYILVSNKNFLEDFDKSSKEIIDVLNNLAVTFSNHNAIIDRNICKTLSSSVIEVCNKISLGKGIKKVKLFVKQINILLSKLEKAIERTNCHKEGFNQQIANCILRFARSVGDENDLENFEIFTSSLEKQLYTLLAMEDSKERENVLNRMLDMICYGISSIDDIKIDNELKHTKNGSVNIFGSNISNISAIGKVKNKSLSMSRNSNISRKGKRDLEKIINVMKDNYSKVDGKSSSNGKVQQKKKKTYCCGNIFSKCFGK